MRRCGTSGRLDRRLESKSKSPCPLFQREPIAANPRGLQADALI
ncbi:hypothetical protein [Lysobacter gummosus]